MGDNEIDRTTAHEYAETVRNYLRLLSKKEGDEVERYIEEITGILVNRSYNHFVQFFARNPEHLKSYQPAQPKTAFIGYKEK